MISAAVVLAGGSGRRAALGRNKALADLGGEPVLVRAIAPFLDLVDRVVVVTRPADRAEVAGLVGPEVVVVDGGPTRPASERSGLAAVGDADAVLVHDAARPLVSHGLVGRVLAAVADGVAVVPALPRPVPVAHWPPQDEGPVLHDAVLVDRSALVGVQTPQAVPAEVLRAAFAAADVAEVAGRSVATDTVEPVLRHRPDVDVVVVPGEVRNLKVTWPHDLDRARRLLESPDTDPPPPGLRWRRGRPTGGPPPVDVEVDGVTPVTDSLRVVRDGHVVRAVDRRPLVDVTGDLLTRDGVLDPSVDDLGTALEQAVLDGATLRLRRRR